MKEILNHPDHQEDDRDAQGNDCQNTQEGERIITGIPEDRRQRSQLFHNPFTNSSENGKNSGKQSTCHL